jgi:hypothetical protein
MGNEYEDYEGEESQPTGKGLRAQLEAALAKLEATEAKLKEKEKVERDISVGSFLQARGLNPKVKELIPESVVETDALEEWVNTYADVFGLAANNTNGQSVNSEDVNAANRLRNLTNSGTRPSSFDDLAERIKREDVDPLELLQQNKDLFLNQ